MMDPVTCITSGSRWDELVGVDYTCKGGETINWQRDCPRLNYRSLSFAFFVMVIPTFLGCLIIGYIWEQRAKKKGLLPTLPSEASRPLQQVIPARQQPDLEQGTNRARVETEATSSLIYPGRILFTGMGFSVIIRAREGAPDAENSTIKLRSDFDFYRSGPQYTMFKKTIHTDEGFIIHVLADPGGEGQCAAFVRSFESKSRTLYLRKRIQPLPAACIGRHNAAMTRDYTIPASSQDSEFKASEPLNESDQRSLDALISAITVRG